MISDRIIRKNYSRKTYKQRSVTKHVVKTWANILRYKSEKNLLTLHD